MRELVAPKGDEMPVLGRLDKDQHLNASHAWRTLWKLYEEVGDKDMANVCHFHAIRHFEKT